MSNYNRIAPFYDRLAKLVFGNSLINAQIKYLDLVSAGSSILILGGGTGKILPNLDTTVSGCIIHFIDSSEGMLNLAKDRKLRNNEIVFCTSLDEAGSYYDVVIVNFFFDQFTDQKINEIIGTLKQKTTDQTKWLISDFVNPKNAWQYTLLGLMYGFFKIICSIEAHKLPDWQNVLAQNELTVHNEHFFYNKFIVSQVFYRT